MLNHHATEPNHRIITDRNLIPNRRIRSDPSSLTDFNSATNFRTCNYECMSAYINVMCNMNMVVDFCTILNNSIRQCASAHSGEGTNFNTIPNDNIANVRQAHRFPLEVALKSEPLFPNRVRPTGCFGRSTWSRGLGGLLPRRLLAGFSRPSSLHGGRPPRSSERRRLLSRAACVRWSRLLID